MQAHDPAIYLLWRNENEFTQKLVSIPSPGNLSLTSSVSLWFYLCKMSRKWSQIVCTFWNFFFFFYSTSCLWDSFKLFSVSVVCSCLLWIKTGSDYKERAYVTNTTIRIQNRSIILKNSLMLSLYNHIIEL